MIKISVVVPVYKSEDSLNELSSRLLSTLEKITSNFEILLVNDASPDDTWNLIKEISSKEISLIEDLLT